MSGRPDTQRSKLAYEDFNDWKIRLLDLIGRGEMDETYLHTIAVDVHRLADQLGKIERTKRTQGGRERRALPRGKQ